jgi:hypothetical protein
LDDDGTRGFRGGGGAMLNAQGPLLRRQELYALLIQFARRIVGKSNFFKARQESNVFYIFTKSSSQAEKPRLMLSHFARYLVYGASLKTALHMETG